MYLKPPESDDHEQPESNEVDARQKPWFEITDQEVKKAVFTSHPNKAPSPDTLTFGIMQYAYTAIPNLFNTLYRVLLSRGYHPQYWREGIRAVLQKPKRNYTLPKSYRIITLLNCLGKISEKILATRLAYFAPEILDAD